MTVRVSTRPLTGTPASGVEVILGTFGKSGRPQVTVWANKYRANPIPLDDPAMVRELIADLTVALDHLENAS